MALLLPYQFDNEIYVGPQLAALARAEDRSVRVHTAPGVWAAPVKSLLELGGYLHVDPSALAELVAVDRFGDVSVLEDSIRTALQWVFSVPARINSLKTLHRRKDFDFQEPFLLANEDSFQGRMQAYYHFATNDRYNGLRVFLKLREDVRVTQKRNLDRIVDLLRRHAPPFMQEPLVELRNLLDAERRDIDRILQVLGMPGIVRAVDTQGRLMKNAKEAA